jgi:hypothetical protein
MEFHRIQAIAALLNETRSRRQALHGLAGVAAAVAGNQFIRGNVVEAKPGGHRKGIRQNSIDTGKRQGTRKVFLCHNGNTIRVGRKAVPMLLRMGARRGPCVHAMARV